jgi:hypothetical protein
MNAPPEAQLLNRLEMPDRAIQMLGHEANVYHSIDEFLPAHLPLALVFGIQEDSVENFPVFLVDTV